MKPARRRGSIAFGISVVSALVMFFLTSTILVGYSLFGEIQDYPATYGYPFAFAYVMDSGRTIFLIPIALVDYVVFLAVFIGLIFALTLSLGALRGSESDQARRTRKAYCLECGRPLRPGAKYCLYDGTPTRRNRL